MISILIESDLLLALIKREDMLKSVAENVLRRIDSGELRGVYASVAAIQEIVFWFYNRGLFGELVTATNALTHLRNLEWVALAPGICLTSSLLIGEYGISPFDAYHAATAISRDREILSADHVYDRIKGIKRIDPRGFVGET